MQGCLWRDGSVHGPFRSAMWRAMRWCMLVKQFGCHFQEHKGHTFYFSRASSPKKIHWSSPCTNTRTPPLVFKDYYRKAINLLLLPDHNPWKLKTFRIQSLNMTSSSTDFCSPGTDSVSLRAIVQYCPSFFHRKVRIRTTARYRVSEDWKLKMFSGHHACAQPSVQVCSLYSSRKQYLIPCISMIFHHDMIYLSLAVSLHMGGG